MSAHLLKPLAERPNGRPGLFGVLAAEFHLERLEPDDYDRLDAVNQIVWEWFGSALRWHFGSYGHTIEPIRPSDLEYIPGLTDRLAEPQVPEDWYVFVSAGKRHAFTDYEVSFHGGEQGSDASPFMYAFWAEMSKDEVDNGLMPCDSVLRICLPDGWDLGDFYHRVTAIAEKLRLRWASAGYSYAMWVPSQTPLIWKSMRAHARRYAGYDLDLHVRAFEVLNTRVRSVNWLTWLGQRLCAELVEHRGAPLASSPLVAIEPAGQALLLRAGDAPERGDVNRMSYPRSYVEADAMIRPVRLAEGADLICDPWTPDELTSWLRRFERRTH